MTYYNEHSKVWLSVDCIIFGFDEGKLIQNPFRTDWTA